MAVINGSRTVAKEPEAETLEQARARLARERHDAETFATRYGLEFVDMTHFRIDNDLFRRVPFELMLRYGFIPETQLDGRLSVVMADPSDVVKIDEMELLLGQPVEVKVGVRSAITEILQKSESAQRVLDEASEDFRIQLVQGTKTARRCCRSTASPPTPRRSSSWSTRRCSTPSSAARPTSTSRPARTR
jgi:hypothetical protein